MTSPGGSVLSGCLSFMLQMGVGLSIAEELEKRQAAKEEERKEEPNEAAAPEQPEQSNKGEPRPWISLSP